MCQRPQLLQLPERPSSCIAYHRIGVFGGQPLQGGTALELAEVTERSKSWLAVRAISAYLESEEWQIARIRKGIRAARAGRVVPGEQ